MTIVQYSTLCQVGFINIYQVVTFHLHHTADTHFQHTHAWLLCLSSPLADQWGYCQTELCTTSLLCCSIMQDISPDSELSRPSGLKDGDAKKQNVEQKKKLSPLFVPLYVCWYSHMHLREHVYTYVWKIPRVHNVDYTCMTMPKHAGAVRWCSG